MPKVKRSKPNIMPKVKRSKPKSSENPENHVPYRRGFKHQTEKQQLKALGFNRIEIIPHALRADKAFFHPIPRCTSIDDWLAQYREEGQTYEEFLADCPWLDSYQRRLHKLTFHAKGKSLPSKYPDAAIYILPVGKFDDKAILQNLMHFTQIFYDIPVKKLDGFEFQENNGEMFWFQTRKVQGVRASARKIKLKSRYDPQSQHIQMQVDGALRMLRRHVPDDALCVVGLSMYDLFADDPDLFVAGMAAGEHNVAVQSLFRYDPNLTFSPEFWHEFSRKKQYDAAHSSRLLLNRSCRVLVHEIAHLLGIDHCINYTCCMNGSGHLEEDFRQPMFLCPVDLRKLQTLCGFDIIGRYQKMADFFHKHGMKEEEMWLVKRIKFIQNK